MSSPRRWDLKTEAALADLADFAAMADEITSRGRGAYDDDITLRLAGEAVVSRTGEAAKRLSDDYRNAHPKVPWRAIRGTRNLVAHEYDLIDHAANWEVLATGLPLLRRLLGLGPGQIR